MAQELHVSPTLIAINSTASTIVGMSTQLFAGRLADRWGPRRVLAGGAGIAALGSLLFAFAPDFGWAGVGRLLVGASVAVASTMRCAPSPSASWPST
jgi:MFS family permease